jgi:hypothetical protein
MGELIMFPGSEQPGFNGSAYVSNTLWYIERFADLPECRLEWEKTKAHSQLTDSQKEAIFVALLKKRKELKNGN